MDVETLSFLCVLYTSGAYQPCKNESLTFNSHSILNCQIWVQYRGNFEIYGSNCPIQGGCMFQ